MCIAAGDFSAFLWEAVVPAAVGLFCAWATLQSFGNYSGWLLAPWLVAAIIAGEVICAVALSRTSLPRRFGGSTRSIEAAALYACASIAWGIALIQLFGTHPGF